MKKKKTFNTMLFSPACASFDQFINFEKRGNFFKKIVRKYLNE
jgi:UDP-N-acetylmuramoylalanine--D-glutamate ligase